MKKDEIITMAHGAGGVVMGELIKEEILGRLKKRKKGIEVPLDALEDASVVEDTVFTTDSYVVKPIMFPGGDIGRLAVSGTVNDLSVMGCRPLAISLGLVIEEGLPVSELRTVLASVAEASLESGVPVVTGDTKVVEKGALDRLIINTSGIGAMWPPLEKNLKVVRKYRKFKGRWLRDSNLRPGDKINITVRRDNALKSFSVVLQNRLGNTNIIKNEYVDILGAVFEQATQQELSKLGLEHGVKVADLNKYREFPTDHILSYIPVVDYTYVYNWI